MGDLLELMSRTHREGADKSKREREMEEEEEWRKEERERRKIGEEDDSPTTKVATVATTAQQ
jgi:hypothetical protein